MAPTLKKKLGQHHLRDGGSCRPLLDFLQPSGRPVVEIGPGGGVLTRELLRTGARVLAWELDREWTFELRRRLADERLSLVLGDALTIEWDRLPAGTLVAGNLPYAVATRLILSLLPAWRTVPHAAFLVQREVAQRLTASPGDADYGSLTVLTAARSRPRILGRVARGAFRPPPEVEGAFVGLELMRPPLPEAQMEAFDETVRLAFAQRRKTLRNALAAGWGRATAEAVLAALGLEARARAERLDLAGFVALHRARLALGAGA